MTVDIKEVAEGLQQYESAGYRPHGIKAHLQLDDSGILRLSEVNLLMTAFDELAANKTESVSTLKSMSAFSVLIVLLAVTASSHIYIANSNTPH